MKKLRYKLICMVFFAASGVFLAVIIILYGALTLYNTHQADGMTQLISLNGGMVPEFQEYKNEDYTDDIPHPLLFNEESEFRTRYFIVYFDEQAQLSNMNTDHIAAVGEETALSLAEDAIAGGNETGYLEQYRYRITKSNNGNTVIFLDCTESFSIRHVTMQIVICIAILIIFLVTLIFAFFSRYVVRPFEQNAKRQKQFITDVSHELKTPLAIISANAEVLQYKNGKNSWTKNITTQTKRMSELIGNLLTLSKMDELAHESAQTSLDFSTLVEETVKPFQEVAAQKNVSMQINITPHISVKGYEEQLRQMISVLTENAVKYVSHNGAIRISLTRNGRHATLTLFNTAHLEPGIDCNRLFDRFYRPDNARSSETGGHGIGLSIAKKAASQHGGTLRAQCRENGICFITTLPCRFKSASSI